MTTPHLDVATIGARLLSDNFQDVLDARSALEALGQQPEVVEKHLGALLNGAAECVDPRVHVAVCKLLRNAVCAPGGVESLLLLPQRASAVDTASLPINGGEATTSMASLIRYLFEALDAENTAIGCAAARAIVDLLAVTVQCMDAAGGGGVGSIPLQQHCDAMVALRLQIASCLPLNPNLLRLLDDSEEGGVASSTAASPQEDARRAAMLSKHTTVLRVLRSIPCSGGGLPIRNSSTATAGLSTTTPGPPSPSMLMFPVVAGNVVDAYLLNDLVQSALVHDDVLLLISGLYAAGCILREAPSSEGGGSGSACTSAENAAAPGAMVVTYITTVLANAEEHALLFPYACRTVAALCWRGLRGVEYAMRENWAALLANFVLKKPVAEGGAASELCPAWLALEALATTGRGLASIATTTSLMENAADDDPAVGATDDATTMVLGSAMQRLAEDYARRGSAASRVALVACVAQVLATSGAEVASLPADRTRAQPEQHESQTTQEQVQQRIVVHMPAVLFRHLWSLRLNAEVDVRRAVWQLVSTGLQSVRAVAAVVGPSCAAHLVAMEPEPDVSVREAILLAAGLCLRDPSLSAFHERLRVVLKAGLYPQHHATVGASSGQ